MDLLTIYATDSDGSMVVLKDDGKNREILGVRENTNMKKLEDLKRKIQENIAQYTEINGGRPLSPQ